MHCTFTVRCTHVLYAVHRLLLLFEAALHFDLVNVAYTYIYIGVFIHTNIIFHFLQSRPVTVPRLSNNYDNIVLIAVSLSYVAVVCAHHVDCTRCLLFLLLLLLFDVESGWSCDVERCLSFLGDVVHLIHPFVKSLSYFIFFREFARARALSLFVHVEQVMSVKPMLCRV